MKKLFNKLKNSRVEAAKNLSATKATLLGSALMVSNQVLAAGGLDEATTAVTEIKTWLYTILGVICLAYCVIQCILALLNKKPWADVPIAMAYCALCGGSIAGATWAWSIWGS